MAYINVGAFVNGVRPRTKKALREALESDPSTVRFDRTAAFDGGSVIRGSDLPTGERLQVTGPDPYTKRSWYATVSLVNGKVKFS